MYTIIHDLKDEIFEEIFPELKNNVTIISDNGKITPCTGCFGCWIKTPARCVIKDGYENMGEVLSKTERLIIISRCCFGGYSPFVKNVIDRSISYLLPFFKIKDGESHHRGRYKNKFSLHVYFYGSDMTRGETEAAKETVKANGKNLNASEEKVFFLDSPLDLRGKAEIKL